MGMVFSLYQASDATIARIVGDPPLVWQLVAPDDPQVYQEARRTARGFLSRLFGKSTDVAPLALHEGDGELAELDKAWHGIHFLLMQTPWDDEPPLGFIAGGGVEIAGQDVGYGPARAFSSQQVRAISSALAALDDTALRSRFDPTAMQAAEIYPDIWDDNDALEYLMQNVTVLRRSLETLASRNAGLVVTLS